jgi:hypothetical protein
MSSIRRTKSQLCREDPDKMILVFLYPKPTDTIVIKASIAAVEPKVMFDLMTMGFYIFDDPKDMFGIFKRAMASVIGQGDGPFEVPLGQTGCTCTIFKMSSLRRFDPLEILRGNECGRFVGMYYDFDPSLQ